MMRSRTKALTAIALLTSLGIVFGYLDFLLPIPIGIPGIKLGLANLVVVFALYAWRPRYALVVSLLRILLCGILFGNSVSFLYSLAGGMVSFLIMLLMKRFTSFGICAVSMLGGVSHNVAQIFVAALIFENLRLAYYLPVLLIAGTITGFALGIVAKMILQRMKKAHN